MNIGEAAKLSGVSAKMIRHYESTGLLSPAKRTTSDYRVYSEKDVYILRFIKQARNLGFPIVLIKDLLSLWHDQRRSSQRVKELAKDHLREIDERIRELIEIKKTLENLVQRCHGDHRPECPILDGLAAEPAEPSQTTKKNTLRRRH